MENIDPPYEERIVGKLGIVTELWHIFFASLQLVINKLLLAHQETVRKVFADSPYTVPVNSINLVCDTDDGAMVVNYPAGVKGATVRVSNAGSSKNKVTLVPNGSEKIDGESSQYLSDGEDLNSIFEDTEYWR